MRGRPPVTVPEVTDRQLEVARLVAAGYTNERIAEELGISLAGAKYHVSELLGRLNLERREEIGRWYRLRDTVPGRSLGHRLGARLAVPLAWTGGAIGLVLLAGVLYVAFDGASGGVAGGGAPIASPTPTPMATEAPSEPNEDDEPIGSPPIPRSGDPFSSQDLADALGLVGVEAAPQDQGVPCGTGGQIGDAWSAQYMGAGRGERQGFILWVYPDASSVATEWDIGGAGEARPIPDGCGDPDSPTYSRENVVMQFASGADDRLGARVVAVFMTLGGAPDGARTGTAAVDGVVALLEAGDAEALTALLRMSDIPCQAPSPGEMPGLPPCPDGVPDETLIPAFPLSACEPEYVLSLDEARAAFPGRVLSLPLSPHTVWELEQPEWTWMGDAHYLLILQSGSFPGMQIFIDGSGAIVGSTSCGPTIPDDALALPLLPGST